MRLLTSYTISHHVCTSVEMIEKNEAVIVIVIYSKLVTVLKIFSNILSHLRAVTLYLCSVAKLVGVA